MTIGGAFLGGGVELVPAGSCKLVLEIRTEDGKNLATTFSVVGGGQTYTATAGTDGRAELTVPSGVTYTVTTSATGYDGLTAQTVVGDSATVQYVRFEAILPRVKKSGDTMDGILYLTKDTTIYNEKNTNVVPTAYENRGSIYFRDYNNTNRAVIRCDADTQYTRTYFSAERYVDGVSKIARFDLRIQSDGRMVAYAPSPRVYDSSKGEWVLNPLENSVHIATCEWVNVASSVVHTAGNEDISGQKNYKGIIKREVSDNSASLVMHHTKAAGSTSTYYNDLLWRDNNITRAYIRCNLFPDGESVQIVPRNASGAYGGEPLTVKWTSTNGMEVHVPSPPSDSNGVNAANTAWVNSKLSGKNGMTEFTSWAELEALIKSGKRGDSFNVTMDFTGLAAIKGATSSSAEIHAYGHYFVDNITVSGGEVTDAEMFGSGEVQFKVDGTTKTFATTGFGRKQVISAHVWGFRVPSEGEMGYAAIINNDNITSCSGYYISI